MLPCEGYGKTVFAVDGIEGMQEQEGPFCNHGNVKAISKSHEGH